MKIAAVIPARFASSRFPGKPLARIAGQTMIERVFRRTEAAGCFFRVFVATDDDRIAREVERFKGTVVMTPATLASGSERVWAAIVDSPDIQAVVNVQGDEPLIPADLLREIHRLLERAAAPVVSAVTRNSNFDEFLSPHVVKAVLDRENRALYFSRAPIPSQARDRFLFFYQHIGVYGYSRSALENFVHAPTSALEALEKLEQLRFLDNGAAIRLVKTDYHAHGVDVPEDVSRIEALLQGE
jgi:3-deoxy-manno-octulosonate cytidylyltransferase (CMP-KDO synthetase)